ncbi:hypothetical protein Tco_0019532 [Tanacetum coccineum]
MNHDQQSAGNMMKPGNEQETVGITNVIRTKEALHATCTQIQPSKNIWEDYNSLNSGGKSGKKDWERNMESDNDKEDRVEIEEVNGNDRFDGDLCGDQFPPIIDQVVNNEKDGIQGCLDDSEYNGKGEDDDINDEEVTTTPSPITTSSSPSDPNAPSKTASTKETTSSHENNSSSFQSKLQLSPTLSNEPTSPQTQNPFLQNLLDVPPRPSNPQPIQTISLLDITLSLSPITPLEIPSSPPSPQPPIMGHPLYYNYHDYHGSTCVCCFHNLNLYLNLQDEMNIMFAHLEYLITTALRTHFPHLP